MTKAKRWFGAREVNSPDASPAKQADAQVINLSTLQCTPNNYSAKQVPTIAVRKPTPVVERAILASLSSTRLKIRNMLCKYQGHGAFRSDENVQSRVYRSGSAFERRFIIKSEETLLRDSMNSRLHSLGVVIHSINSSYKSY